eukprot:12675-Heterococcus_DN1.PRE.8
MLNTTLIQYGAGPMCNTCHVMIPPQFFNKLPQPFEDEKEELEDTVEQYLCSIAQHTHYTKFRITNALRLNTVTQCLCSMLHSHYIDADRLNDSE